MSLPNPVPVKLTKAQRRQMAELVKRTNLNRSQLLRLCVAHFLDEFSDKPEQVNVLFGKLGSLEESGEYRITTTNPHTLNEPTPTRKAK